MTYLGIFTFQNLKIKGKLSSEINLAIDAEILSPINTPQLYKSQFNERIDKSGLSYFYYFPIKLAKKCEVGQYFDLKKFLKIKNNVIIFNVHLVIFVYNVLPINIKVILIMNAIYVREGQDASGVKFTT